MFRVPTSKIQVPTYFIYCTIFINTIISLELYQFFFLFNLWEQHHFPIYHPIISLYIHTVCKQLELQILYYWVSLLELCGWYYPQITHWCNLKSAKAFTLIATLSSFINWRESFKCSSFQTPGWSKSFQLMDQWVGSIGLLGQ